MTHRPLALATALGALVAAPLAAQAPDSAACANVFAGSPTVVDSLVLVATPGYKLKDVADPGMKNLAIGIATSLELPTPLALPPVVNLWHRNGAVMGTPVNPSQGFAAEAALDIDRRGAVTKVALSQSSLSPALDSALLRAVTSATEIGLRRSSPRRRGAPAVASSSSACSPSPAGPPRRASPTSRTSAGSPSRGSACRRWRWRASLPDASRSPSTPRCCSAKGWGAR